MASMQIVTCPVVALVVGLLLYIVATYAKEPAKGAAVVGMVGQWLFIVGLFFVVWANAGVRMARP